MADPGTLAIAGMASSGASGVMGAIGKLMGGGAESSAFQYQAGVARINQQIAKGNADYSRKVGEIQAQQEGMKSAQEIGATKAGQSGSGLDINKGSPAAVRETQSEVAQYDQSMIRSNAARKAYGYELEATSEEAKANMAEASAKNAKTAGTIGAFTSLLSAGSSVASKWLNYKPTFGSAESPLAQAQPGDYGFVG